MRHSWLAIPLLLSLLSACSDKETRTIDTIPGATLNEQRFRQLVKGSYCVAPAGVSIEDGCVDASSARQAGYEVYVPSSVSLEHDVAVASTGGGYIYKMKVHYADLPQLPEDNFVMSWSIYQDDVGLGEPNMGDLESYFSQLRRFSLRSEGRPSEFVSNKLVPGRRYTFYVVGSYYRMSRPVGLIIFADVLHARVVLDLTKAAPPN